MQPTMPKQLQTYLLNYNTLFIIAFRHRKPFQTAFQNNVFVLFIAHLPYSSFSTKYASSCGRRFCFWDLPIGTSDHCKAPLSVFIWKKRYINAPLYFFYFLYTDLSKNSHGSTDLTKNLPRIGGFAHPYSPPPPLFRAGAHHSLRLCLVLAAFARSYHAKRWLLFLDSQAKKKPKERLLFRLLFG